MCFQEKRKTNSQRKEKQSRAILQQCMETIKWKGISSVQSEVKVDKLIIG